MPGGQEGICEAGRRINVNRLYAALNAELRVMLNNLRAWKEQEALAVASHSRATAALKDVRAEIIATREKVENFIEAIENGLGSSMLVNNALLEQEKNLVVLEQRRANLLEQLDARPIGHAELLEQLDAAAHDDARAQLVDAVVASARVKSAAAGQILIADLILRVQAA